MLKEFKRKITNSNKEELNDLYKAISFSSIPSKIKTELYTLCDERSKKLNAVILVEHGELNPDELS
jgi:hypothetical protein